MKSLVSLILTKKLIWFLSLHFDCRVEVTKNKNAFPAPSSISLCYTNFVRKCQKLDSVNLDKYNNCLSFSRLLVLNLVRGGWKPDTKKRLDSLSSNQPSVTGACEVYNDFLQFRDANFFIVFRSESRGISRIINVQVQLLKLSLFDLFTGEWE